MDWINFINQRTRDYQPVHSWIYISISTYLYIYIYIQINKNIKKTWYNMDVKGEFLSFNSEESITCIYSKRKKDPELDLSDLAHHSHSQLCFQQVLAPCSSTLNYIMKQQDWINPLRGSGAKMSCSPYSASCGLFISWLNENLCKKYIM